MFRVTTGFGENSKGEGIVWARASVGPRVELPLNYERTHRENQWEAAKDVVRAYAATQFKRVRFVSVDAYGDPLFELLDDTVRGHIGTLDEQRDAFFLKSR